jgi:hypothetical protein
MVVTKTRFAAGILMAQRANLLAVTTTAGRRFAGRVALPAPERIHHVLPKSFK